METLSQMLRGGENPRDEESGILAQISEATTLNTSTKIKWFVILFSIGIILSLLGSFILIMTLQKGLVPFAILYTVGNIMSMASTCCLMGPVNQLKKMFAPTRVVATILVFVMFFLTLYAAFVIHKGGLVLLFIFLQFSALTWYSISYIPYARDAVRGIFTSILG